MSDFDAKAFVATLPVRPGVYRMFDAEGTILYVGKAKNLKARVGSYFRADQVHPKVMTLVRQVASMEVTVTRSDTEALLLEFNLIKRHKPRYNVLLKDDKSFPYIHLSPHAYSRLAFYRGSRKLPGRLFGPFPNPRAVRETLQQLQKLFRLRNCRDGFFENRSRPCLQYQIKRCSGPCVGLIAPEAYAKDVAAAVMVLEGRNVELSEKLSAQMEEAAAALEFERAAALRDQLAALKAIQAQQVVTSTSSDADVDLVAIASEGTTHCIALMFVRGGRSLGTTTFFPKAPISEPAEVLAAFIAQYYLEREPPREILTSIVLEDADVLAATLAEKSGRRVDVRQAQRGLKQRWAEVTQENADNGLRMRLSSRASVREQLEAIRVAFGMTAPPLKLECFDISHTMGEATVAACVVFGPEGPLKTEYRRYNIEGIEPGDDYGAMRQALTRRFKRVKAGEVSVPDVLLIDGGKGQLAEAGQVLQELEVTVPLVLGVSKGPDRKVGQERLFLLGHEAPSILPPDSKALLLIQRIRDEAHRFAIAGHRRARGKSRQSSILEAVPGLGPAKRRELLKAFGGLQGVVRAGVADLAAVKGIGDKLAASIYEHLHPGAT